jgi:hypothetical protein
MAVNPLPPQAYTKETLQKAYAWLLNQNASIKEMASTQDMLISLYLKAQRGGDAALETPSIQNFKQELKTLANMMGDLQTPPAATNSHSQNYSTSSASTSFYTQPITAQSNTLNLLNQLDQSSLNAINEVKTTLNLSSDTEALRALIALGQTQFKKIN